MDPLEQVLEESIKLGTRSFTTNFQGYATLRLHLEPEREHISRLRVFLAHATVDREWADAVHDMLIGMGFYVTYLRAGDALSSSLSPKLPEPELKRLLGEQIRQADYLCILLSKQSATRDWVQFELAYASHLIGRAVVLLADGLEDSAFMNWPSFAHRAMLTARYTVLSWDPTEDDLALRFGRALINDPEEGVTDGSYRPLVVSERDLRRENRLRQHFRMFLDNVPEYAGRHVIDVLPFSWEACEARAGDVRTVFNWFVQKFGRLNMMVQVARRHFNVAIVQSPTTADIADIISTPTALALVIWVREWSAAQEVPNRVWWFASTARPQLSMKIGGDRSRADT
jgi:hypothetical protein